MLLDYLVRCEFDSHLEKLIDQSTDFESWEIDDLKKEYYSQVCPLTAVTEIDSSSDDAIDVLDMITTEEYISSKMDINIPTRFDYLLRSYYSFSMAIFIQDDYFLIDRYEEELFDRLDNYQQKNFKSMLDDGWDNCSIDIIKSLNYRLHDKYESEISKQMYKFNPSIDIIDKCRILKAFKDIYEPDFDDIDFISRFDEDDFRELINSLNTWLQYLVYCDEHGEPSNKDYMSGIIIDCVLNWNGSY